MDKKELDIKKISSLDDLNVLIDRFKNGPVFAHAFKFEDYSLQEQFFSAIGVDLDVFNRQYFYFDKEKCVHISESENNYIWISSLGLVSPSRFIGNKTFNAFVSQHLVLSLLIDKAIHICNSNDVYDIDSIAYEDIGDLSIALYHNFLFYLELIVKVYLTIFDVPFPFNHELSILYPLFKKTIFKLHHDKTIFRLLILPTFEEHTIFLSEIKDFKPQRVKYNDNEHDSSVIDFRNIEYLKNFVDESYGCMCECYYEGNNSFYLQPLDS